MEKSFLKLRSTESMNEGCSKLVRNRRAIAMKRFRRSKQNRKLKANMESLREDMAEISEQQQRIKDGQMEIRSSFEEIESQCDKLNKETSLIFRQTLYNQQRLCLIFKILKAREDNDFSMATEHTRFLRGNLEEKNRAFGGAIRKNRAAWKVSRATPLFHIYMLKVLTALHEDRSVMDEMIPYYQPQYPTAAELTVPQHMLAQPAMPQYGINFAATPQDRRDKKRKIDAEYRQRCKVNKEKREIELQHLREENAQLKRENEFCREENDSMAHKLWSKEVEIGNLKSEICNSKKVISNQEILLDTLSQKPFLQQIMHGCNRLEVALLENERNILYQNANWDGWESERKQLFDEIEKLKHRNMMLKMQNQVLGDKILSQKDTEASMRRIL
uniref:Uncharacterized protein n=1 Tax=Populus alba TaxID=43335 RepID=A0A4U5QIT9_POPAL|nr:hypothetical protein D5086_0000098140 [Populus alba]